MTAKTLGAKHIVVGTRDFERTLELYHGDLGLEILARPVIGASYLALWGLPNETQAKAVLLGTTGQTHGLLLLTSFGDATGSPVREKAQPFDYSPKNLDFQVKNLAAAYEALSAKGYTFRSEPVFYEHHGARIGEVQMIGPDAVNVVLLESDLGGTYHFSPKGFTGATQWILTVGDLAGNVRLFQQAFGLPIATESSLHGPDIERMIGLPSGAALRIKVLAQQTSYGRIELIHYDRAPSRDFTPDARPPRSGLLQVALESADVDTTVATLTGLGCAMLCAPLDLPNVFGVPSRAASVIAPSGLMIEVWQSAD